MAHYFQGLALENLLRYAEAAEAFDERRPRPATTPRTPSCTAPGPLRRIGKIDEAKKILHGLEKHGGSSAEYHFQQGAMLAADGELELAVGRAGEGPQPRQGPQRRPLRAGVHQRPVRQRRDGRRLLQAMHRAPARPAGRLDQPGRPLRGRDAVPRGRAVLPPGARPRAEPRPRPAVRQGLPGQQGDVLRRGSREGIHRPQAASGNPRHRLRALGPQPQLPAEDEHPDARRPDPDDRDRASGQQELRRDLARRDQGDDAVEGRPAGHGAGRRRRTARPPTTTAPSRRRRSRPRSRPCSASRSAS